MGDRPGSQHSLKSSIAHGRKDRDPRTIRNTAHELAVGGLVFSGDVLSLAAAELGIKDW
jgi:hypothetical protein